MSSFTMTRRSFLKLSAAGAMGAAALSFAPLKANQAKAEQAAAAYACSKRSLPVEAAIDLTTGKVTPNPDILMQNSACLGCYASCGNRVKIDKKYPCSFFRHARSEIYDCCRLSDAALLVCNGYRFDLSSSFLFQSLTAEIRVVSLHFVSENHKNRQSDDHMR